MKILMIILLCLCLLLQIGCMGNPDTKESHQSGTETTLTEENMTDAERDSETTAAVSGVDNNAPISMTNGELIDFLSLFKSALVQLFHGWRRQKILFIAFLPFIR